MAIADHAVPIRRAARLAKSDYGSLIPNLPSKNITNEADTAPREKRRIQFQKS